MPPDPQMPKVEVTIILAEYKSLRDESIARMNHRITLLTSSTASSAILLGLALERQSNWLLLLVPMTACLFGLLILHHNVMIYAVGDYMKLCIEPRLNKFYPFVLGWHLSILDPRFRNIFGVWHLPMTLSTLVPSIAAILLTLTSQKIEPGMLILLILDISLIFYFLAEYRWRVCKKNYYRFEVNKEWKQKLYENDLIE